ncbi:MAG: hypothetical protein EPN93_12520 [Spirochaetes bacterium]|nr:MAG: hypothetical protein EPN93_12520 [Spirochaetota bacterium]
MGRAAAREAVMKGDLFKGIMQWEFGMPKSKLKKKEFRLPVFYYDNSSLTAIFTASTKKVLPFLPDPRMHPAEVMPGRCLVAFTAFEYRKTDIDPYNEFSIAVIVSYGKRPIPGLTVLSQMRRKCYDAYVWHLPVTTEIARYGGVELYGYPKILAKIDITRGRDAAECVLSEKKTHILTLRGPVLHTKPGGIIRYRTYPVREGVTLCGNVYSLHHQFAETRSTKGVSLTLGTDHEICRQLRSVGLSEKALMYQYSPLNESILFGPHNLIDD